MASRIDLFDRSRGETGKSLGVQARGRRSFEDLGERTGGEWLREGTSSVLRVRRRIPAGTLHGAVPLSEPGLLNTRVLGMLFPHPGGARHDGARSGGVRPGDGHFQDGGPGKIHFAPSFSDLAFFDIETTGLSGGAGTLVFLAGVLKAGNGEILLTQYFMQTISSERLFLRLLSEELGSAFALVSYNGRCFDYGIIKNRLILCGFSPAEREPVHFDLLHPSRRIWKGRLPDFTLQTVERSVLMLERKDDIPGYRIPEVYFQYLRNGEVTEDLLAVFTHNRIDTLSLVALLLKQLSLVHALAKGRALGDSAALSESAAFPESGGEQVSYNPGTLSDMLLRGNFNHEARRLLERHSRDSDALKRLALLCKRERLLVEACETFQKLLDRAKDLWDYVFACTELAKLYEHGMHDLGKALMYAERAMGRIGRAGFFSPGSEKNFENVRGDLAKRILRINRKLGGA